MHRFDTPVPPRLTIDVHAGIVTIDAADVTETTVDVQPRHDSANAHEVIAASTVEQHGDEIVVRVPRRNGAFFGRSVDIAVTITTPPARRSAIETGSADVGARGRFAHLVDCHRERRRRARRDHRRPAAAQRQRRRPRSRGRRRSGGADRLRRRPRRRRSAAPVRCSRDPATSRSATAVASLRVKTGSGDVTVGTAPDDLAREHGLG